MNVPRFRGRGSTAVRRAFWDQLSDYFATQQKLGGHNVVVDEFPGEGTQINIAALTGACCHWYGCAEETFVQCMSDSNFPVWMGAGTRCADVDCPSYACCYCDADPDCFNAADPAMCEYYGFASAGLGTTCDDCATSESVPPCGCCCFDGDCSYPWTQSDCEGSGGEFTEGLCCSPIPHCDSISASKTKCGCEGYITRDGAVPIVYQNIHANATYVDAIGTCFCDLTAHIDQDDSCTFTVDSNTYDSDGGRCPTCPGFECCVIGCDSFFVGGVVSDTYSERSTSGEGWSEYQYTELSNEYTTEQLIEDTLTALPGYWDAFDCEPLPEGCDDEEVPCEYPGPGQGCDCSAYLHVSDDELTCDVRAFEYYIEIIIQSFDQLVTWVERFTPDDGGDPIDTERSETVLAGDIYTSDYAVDVPTDYGETTIEDIVCTPA